MLEDASSATKFNTEDLFGTTTSGTPGGICVGVAGNIVDLPTVIK